MRPRISLRGSVLLSVHRSVVLSVRPLVRNQLFSKSEIEGFFLCISSGKSRNITEMLNCISIEKYACWSVRLFMLKVKKRSKRMHLLVDETCFLFLNTKQKKKVRMDNIQGKTKIYTFFFPQNKK